METREIREYLSDFEKSLNENTGCLIRIEERLKNFIERVQEHELELEDVKKHVVMVRTVARAIFYAAGAFGAVAGIIVGIWQAVL